MLKYIITTILVLFCAFDLSAQSSDSLLIARADSIYASDPTDLALYQTYFELIQSNIRVDSSKSAYYSHRSITIADSVDSELGYALGKTGLSLHLIVQGDYKEGLHNALEAESYFQQYERNDYLAMVYSYIGTAYSYMGFNNEALRFYLRSDSLMQFTGSPLQQAQIKANIGILYGLEGDDRATIRYFKEAMEVIESVGNKQQIALGYHNIGVAFGNIQESDSALSYLNKALEIREELNYDFGIAATSFSIGSVYYDLELYELALNFLERAQKIQQKTGDKANYSATTLKMGNTLKQLKRYDQAYSFAEEALDISQQMNNLNQEADAYLFLSELEFEDENYESAYSFLNEYQQLRDTLIQQNRDHAFEEMRARYEAENMEQQISELQQNQRLQEAEIARATVLRRSLIGGAFGLLLIIGLLFQRYRITRKHEQVLTDKNKKLEELSEEKSEYLHIAAHDLKTPLSSVAGLAELIKLPSTTIEEAKEHADYIHISAYRMLDLVKQFLDVDAIESGQKMADNKPVDLMPQLKEAVEHYTYRADWKDISMEASYEADKLPAVADSALFKEVVDNIISNAVKYCSKGDSILVSTQTIGDYVRISIKDSGPGLSEEDQKKLFQKFTRLTPDPTGNEGSTGLGLYIAKRMVTAMHGSIRCKSTLGEGSTFILELPADKSA